jgi:hypothetical protein
MLFVGYDSLKERPGETAAWLRSRLRDFYPVLPPGLLQKRDAALRESALPRYEELFLVGHSLGGVVVRLALQQQAKIWLREDRAKDAAAPRPALLDAQVRLFSPASAGFQPVGLASLLSCLLAAGTVVLRMAPAFVALKRPSELLDNTQRLTEELIKEHGPHLGALRAWIVWARPETVVERNGYGTDYESESLIPQRNHIQVCKPHDGYDEPRRFVETGKHR